MVGGDFAGDDLLTGRDIAGIADDIHLPDIAKLRVMEGGRAAGPQFGDSSADIADGRPGGHHGRDVARSRVVPPTVAVSTSRLIYGVFGSTRLRPTIVISDRAMVPVIHISPLSMAA